MSTFAQLVDDVRSYLRSYVRDQELSTHLTADLNASALQMSVGDGTVISRGRVEIDDELIWIDRVDRANSVASIAPYGRGMDGTTAATHTTNSRVIVQPLFPRKVVKNTINQVIDGVGNQLFGVDTEVVTSSATSLAYELPTYVERVLNVSLGYDQIYGDSEYVRRWKFDPNAPSSSTGKMLYIYEPIISGLDLAVTHFRKPLHLTTDNSAFSSSLLPSTSYDVILLGTASRLMATATAYMSSARSLEAQTLDQRIDLNSVTNQAKYLYSMYLQRLDEEKQRLLNSYVNRSHFTG